MIKIHLDFAWFTLFFVNAHYDAAEDRQAPSRAYLRIGSLDWCFGAQKGPCAA